MSDPYPIRLRVGFGTPELEVIVSLEGLVPICFSPDEKAIYILKTLPPDSEIWRLIRKAIEKDVILACAVKQHGDPDVAKLVNLKGPAKASPREVSDGKKTVH
jgi:hypothetical protein